MDDSNELVERTHSYKYFIAQKTAQKDQIFLKKIEYEWRRLKGHNRDEWPYSDAEKNLTRVNNGWLLSGETKFQLHFFGNPLELWTEEEALPKYGIQVKPWRKGSSGVKELSDFVMSQVVSLKINIIFNLKIDFKINSIKLKSFDESQIVSDQVNGTFNALNDSNVYTSFRIRSYENPTNLVPF